MAPKAAQNKDTGPIKDKRTSRPTVSHDATLKDRKRLLSTCSQIGALIIGQRHDKMNDAIDVLNLQAAGLLLAPHLEVWLPRYREHMAKLEDVVGKGLDIDQSNLVNDLRSKIQSAGYDSIRDFVVKVLIPVLTYNGVLKFLHNDAKVTLPAEAKAEFEKYSNRLKYVVGGACAAMALQEAMGM